jgi:uncharacterized membrane protein YfcA
MDIAPHVFVWLFCAAFLAGLIDAVVGGGGLIQVPALFAGLPQHPPATLLGTNKLAGVWGTAVATLRYARVVRVEWGAAVPGALAALVFAFLGSYAVTQFPSDNLRKLLPVVLLVVAIYTLWKKDLGSVHRPAHRGWQEKTYAATAGALLGFYDGFFGPGTGSFLVFLYVRFFGFNFLSASAAAKVVNVACNVASLAWFVPSGHVLWKAGLGMAVFNIAGSLVGSRMAILRGSGFVRQIFLFVVFALILKTGYDGFLR